MIITLIIPVLPKTPNSIGKASIWQSTAERRRWRKTIYEHMLHNYATPAIFNFPYKQSKITLIRHSTHPMDPDNLPGSFKYVIDALKFNKIIEDDSSKHIELTCLWEKAKRGEGKITITIEEITG